MKRRFLKSKIHRAAITEANIDYEGSVTIDVELMKMVDIAEFEMVQVVNINNGARFETYAIKGKAGERAIGLNGAAARLGLPGDRVIIMSYCDLDTQEIAAHQPKIIVLDEKNHIIREGKL
jgi:aspartate 1-decarboxylase